MKEQQDLFERGAKLAILTRVACRHVLTPRMLAVLRAIDDRARDQAETTLTLAQIGGFLNMSRETAKRGVADLVRNSLLIKTETKSRSGKQANTYKIVWATLRAIGDGEAFELKKPKSRKSAKSPVETASQESTQVVIPATGQIEVDPGHCDPSDGSQRPPDPGHSDPSLHIAPLRINNPPPSLGSGSPPDWAEVEEDLFSLGVGAAAAAIREARNRECQPADVARLIAHYRSQPGAWGPGAIHDRVCSARPGEDPTSGWAVPSADWQRQQQQARQAEQREQASRESAELRNERQDRQAASQQREAEFGPLLDAMRDEDCLDFAREHCPDLVPHLRRNPDYARSGLFRDVLLSALKNLERMPQL